MELYDAVTSKKLDKLIIEKGSSTEQLIMRAAYEVYSVVKKFLKPSTKIWCLAGTGNNGGDAIAVAGLSLMAGNKATLILLKPPKGPAFNILKFFQSLKLKCKVKLPDLKQIGSNDIIIDGLVGTGLSRPPEPWLEDAINWTNRTKLIGCKIVSVDVPSGLNASNGLVYEPVVKADATIMCLSPKQGCFTGSAPKFVGNLFYANLGYKNLAKMLPGTSKLITRKNLGIRKRLKTDYKHSFGKILILGGWNQMEGAAFLAAKAAFKTGTGKVFVCGPTNSINLNEIIIVNRSLSDFSSIIANVDCIVAGPGLGNNATEFLKKSWESDKPLVLDADGLYWLSREKPPIRNAPFIGTPHTGEAKFLLGHDIESRFTAIKKLKTSYGGEWILKGAGTLVTTSTKTYVNPFSDSILATAGSGDVLAGMVGSLIAQKVKNPGLVAVWLHSQCARLLLKKGEVAIIASDLLQKVSKSLKKIS